MMVEGQIPGAGAAKIKKNIYIINIYIINK